MFLVFSSLLNVALDIVCVVTLQMGVAGAGWATLISQLISGLLCLLYMDRKFPILHLKKENLLWRGHCVRRLLIMGLPMGLQYSITAIGSILLQTAVNGLGAVSMAAVAASGKETNLFATPYDAMGTMAATLRRAEPGCRKAGPGTPRGEGLLHSGVAYSLAALVVMYFLGAQMTALFLDSKDVASSAQILPLARQLLVTNGAFYIPLLGGEPVPLHHSGPGLFQSGRHCRCVRDDRPGRCGGPGVRLRLHRRLLRQPRRLGSGGLLPAPRLFCLHEAPDKRSRGGAGIKGPCLPNEKSRRTGGRQLTNRANWGIVKTQRVLPVGRLPHIATEE